MPSGQSRSWASRTAGGRPDSLCTRSGSSREERADRVAIPGGSSCYGRLGAGWGPLRRFAVTRGVLSMRFARTTLLRVAGPGRRVAGPGRTVRSTSWDGGCVLWPEVDVRSRRLRRRRRPLPTGPDGGRMAADGPSRRVSTGTRWRRTVPPDGARRGRLASGGLSRRGRLAVEAARPGRWATVQGPNRRSTAAWPRRSRAPPFGDPPPSTRIDGGCPMVCACKGGCAAPPPGRRRCRTPAHHRRRVPTVRGGRTPAHLRRRVRADRRGPTLARPRHRVLRAPPVPHPWVPRHRRRSTPHGAARTPAGHRPRRIPNG